MQFKFLTLLFIVGMSNLLSAQCAMCRAVLESSSNLPAAKGINDGILYLMAIPYILIAIVGYFVYYKNKPK